MYASHKLSSSECLSHLCCNVCMLCLVDKSSRPVFGETCERRSMSQCCRAGCTKAESMRQKGSAPVRADWEQNRELTETCQLFVQLHYWRGWDGLILRGFE